MSNINSPTTSYIKKLWSENKLNKKFTVEEIQKLASTDGYTFEKNAIRMALSRASYMAKPTKNKKNKTIYSQKYPPTMNNSDSTEILHDVIFKSLNMHKEIRKVSSNLFLNGHYDQAIFASFKKINNMVKKKSKQTSKDGKDLMLSIFRIQKPILKLNKLKTVSESDEQDGFMHIFAGSMQGIRNPRAHDDEKSGDPWDAIEHICLASMLAKKVDKSKK